jgi:hypothetical protein
MYENRKRREKCTRCWWESLKERDQSEDWGIDGRMGSKWILGRLVERIWSGFSWLRIETGGRRLWTHDEPSSSGITELVSCQPPYYINSKLSVTYFAYTWHANFMITHGHWRRAQALENCPELRPGEGGCCSSEIKYDKRKLPRVKFLVSNSRLQK